MLGHGLYLEWESVTVRIMPGRELPSPASPGAWLLSSLEALFGPGAQRGAEGRGWKAQEGALHSPLRGKCL